MITRAIKWVLKSGDGYLANAETLEMISGPDDLANALSAQMFNDFLSADQAASRLEERGLAIKFLVLSIPILPGIFDG